MPLNKLFCYLFRNEAGDLQFLNLIDDRWPKMVITQKINLQLLSEVILNLETGKQSYYLICKGAEADVKRRYDADILEEKKLKSLQSKTIPVGSHRKLEKQVTEKGSDNLTNVVVREESSKKGDEISASGSDNYMAVIESSHQKDLMTKSVYKEPLKRKADNDTRLTELIRETKKKSNLDSMVCHF